MGGSSRPHRVAVLTMRGVLMLDLSIPVQVFSFPPYQVRVCGDGTVAAGARKPASIAPVSSLRAVSAADTVVVPGFFPLVKPPPHTRLSAVRRACERGARVGAVCTGVLALGHAGLLDGRQATTHWLYHTILAESFPQTTTVRRELMWVADGPIYTCATPAGAMDMCIAMIAADLGDDSATDRRHILGFAQPPCDVKPDSADDTNTPPSHSRTAGTRAWTMQRLQDPITLVDMAAHAGTSTRSFSRWFLDEMGTTPIQWLQAARVERARMLLESTWLSIDDIARITGLGTRANFRRRFVGQIGVMPSAYRRVPRSGTQV
jgi:transcriptional regulator GlxA family with amidase domain